ncbi:cancer-related nucleoside-triphosphatase [Lissotriton helveticus]
MAGKLPRSMRDDLLQARFSSLNSGASVRQCTLLNISVLNAAEGDGGVSDPGYSGCQTVCQWTGPRPATHWTAWTRCYISSDIQKLPFYEQEQDVTRSHHHHHQDFKFQPGVGKTTLVQKTVEALKSTGIPIDGFYTEEVRQSGKRVGFDVVTLSGKRGTLSRVGSSSRSGRMECRVGQYVVDLSSFEDLALPVLRNVKTGSSSNKTICVLDEIGKMELFSQSFTQLVQEILNNDCVVVLGTIPVPKTKPLVLVEEIKKRRDVKIFYVTKENRNDLLQEILTTIENCRE